MERDEIAAVVRILGRVLRQLAGSTRSQADDLFVSIVRSNEVRLSEVVEKLLAEENAGQPLSDQQITDALQSVGIKAAPR